MDNHHLTRRKFVKIASAGTFGAMTVLPSAIFPAHMSNSEQKENSETIIPKRVLGRTGLEFSPLGFGAMRTSDPAVIRKGIEMGINNIDTARGYMDGRNEEIVGEAVAGIRDRVYITSKIKPHGFERMREDLNDSLKALNTDYIDIILLHGLREGEQLKNEEYRKFLSKARDEGKVRFIGFSTHKNVANLIQAAAEDQFFEVILAAYNFTSNESVTKAIETAVRRKIGIIAMKTQAGGYQSEEMGNLKPHPAALMWVLSNRNVTSAIPSMITFDQLEENYSALTQKMGWMERKTLHRYGNAIDRDFCRMCDYCAGQCPHGISVSDINRCIMYADVYNDRELALTNFREIRMESDLTKCADCTECIIKCKNNLRIPAKIERALELFA